MATSPSRITARGHCGLIALALKPRTWALRSIPIVRMGGGTPPCTGASTGCPGRGEDAPPAVGVGRLAEAGVHSQLLQGAVEPGGNHERRHFGIFIGGLGLEV